MPQVEHLRIGTDRALLKARIALLVFGTAAPFEWSCNAFFPPPHITAVQRKAARKNAGSSVEERSSPVLRCNYYLARSELWGEQSTRTLLLLGRILGYWTDQTLAHPTTPCISQAMLAARWRASPGAGGTSSHASRRDSTPDRLHGHGGTQCRHLHRCKSVCPAALPPPLARAANSPLWVPLIGTGVSRTRHSGLRRDPGANLATLLGSWKCRRVYSGM